MSKLTDGLQNALESVSSEFGNILTNPIAAGVGGAIVGGSVVGITAAAVRRKSSGPRKKKSVSRSSAKRNGSRRGARKRSPKYARTAGKRKDSSSRRIRMTKNGQPYVILASGKARFIKKSSAKLSRKRKGGRY